MKPNPLPTIIITGTTQDSLFELIVLSGMLGYDLEGRYDYDFESEHKQAFIKLYGRFRKIIAVFYEPHHDLMRDGDKTFRADQVQEIINYVTEYNPRQSV